MLRAAPRKTMECAMIQREKEHITWPQVKAPQAAWYDLMLLKNHIFKEVTSWITHQGKAMKNANLKINNLDIRKQSRLGDSYTVVIIIPQNFSTQQTRWRNDLKFYAPHLLSNCATLSPPWDQVEPPQSLSMTDTEINLLTWNVRGFSSQNQDNRKEAASAHRYENSHLNRI